VLLGAAAERKPGKALLAEDGFALLEPRVADALQPALARIVARLGAMPHVTVSEEGLPQWFDVFRTLQGGEIWAQHGEWVQRVRPNLGPGVKQRMEWAATIEADDVSAAKVQRERIASRLDALLANHAVLVLPTVPDIAPPVHAPPQSTDDFRARAMRLLCIAGLGRLPQINLPYAKLDGCSVGISLLAARDNDEMLLAIARELG
jgi:amidase